MAVGNTGNLVFASGQLCYAPLNLLNPNTFPFGGTPLGLVKNVVVQVSRKTVPIREEPFGPMPFDAIDLGETWVMTGSFRTYDEDVVSQVFASVVTGAGTGTKGVFYPNANTFRTGGLLSARGIKLLLAPDDVENQRFFYGYNAVPLTDEDAKMPFQRGEEWVVPFKFIFLPDASNRTVAYQMREDITL